MQYIRASLLSVRANWSLFRGNFKNAILRFEKLRQISEKRHGYGHIKTAPILFKLALAYHHSGGADNFRFAIFLYQRVLNIAESSNAGRTDILTGNIALAMGDWYAQIANYEMAQSSYQKSVQAFERFFGASSLRLLSPLYSRAKALRMLGRVDQAEQLEQQAAWIEEAHARMNVSYDYRRQYPHF